LLLVCCSLALDAPAEPLGRLFHTPEQRALLDNARKTMPMNVGGEERAPSAPDFTLKGVVTRSDGKRSVWLNDRLEHGSGRSGDQVPVQLPGGEIKLKVGQSIDPATGRVTEGYRRPPPEPVAKPLPEKPTGKAPSPRPRDEDSDPDSDAGKSAP
jgi:hypothetical protein